MWQENCVKSFLWHHKSFIFKKQHALVFVQCNMRFSFCNFLYTNVLFCSAQYLRSFVSDRINIAWSAFKFGKIQEGTTTDTNNITQITPFVATARYHWGKNHMYICRHIHSGTHESNTMRDDNEWKDNHWPPTTFGIKLLLMGNASYSWTANIFECIHFALCMYLYVRVSQKIKGVFFNTSPIVFFYNWSKNDRKQSCITIGQWWAVPMFGKVRIFNVFSPFTVALQKKQKIIRSIFRLIEDAITILKSGH